MPAPVVKAAVGCSPAVFFRKVGFAVFRFVFGEACFVGPSADVMVSYRVVGGETEPLERFVEAGPLLPDVGGFFLEGVHDQVSAGEHEGGVLRESVYGLDAALESLGRAQFWGDMDVGEVSEAE